MGQLGLQFQEMICGMKQQDEVVQDRCPDIVQASGGCAVVVLTEKRAEFLVGMEGNLDSEGEREVMEGLLEVILSEGGPIDSERGGEVVRGLSKVILAEQDPTA